MKTLANLRCLSVIAVVVMLGIMGCQAPPKIHTKTKPGVDLSGHRSFVVMPLPPSNLTNKFSRTRQLLTASRDAAAGALAAKGLVEAAEEQAELCVRLSGSTVPRSDVREWSVGASGAARVTVPEPHQHYRPASATVVEPHRTVWSYNEHTSIVDVFDNKSKEPLWSGWVTSRSKGPVKVEEVTNNVRRIIAEFKARPSER